MTVYRDSAKHTREAVSASVGAGESFIEKCAQLDERMREVEVIGTQLGNVDRALTALEDAFERTHPSPSAASSLRSPR